MSTNLFDGIPANLPNELVEPLLSHGNVLIERIISHGHASPDDSWYDQSQHEWVMLLKGSALLRFEGDAHAISLKPGDAVNIPARRRHRVEWTTPNEPTVWLAVHYGDGFALPTESETPENA